MNKDSLEKVLKLLKNKNRYYLTKKEFEKINPNNVYIVPTFACNLSCRYCNLEIYNKLNWKFEKEKFEKAIKYLIKKQIKEVIMFGGEPLIVKNLIKQWSNKFRKTSKINIFTNATLLDIDMLNFIVDNKINIIISIDGNKKINDINRKFKYFKSVYDIIIKKTNYLTSRNYPFSINMVIATNNVRYFSNSIKHLLKLKPQSITWCIDLYPNWTDKHLRLLYLEIKKAYLIHLYLIKNNKISPLINFIAHKEKSNIPAFLMPDGNFYFNELFFYITHSALRYKIKSTTDFIRTMFKVQKYNDEKIKEKIDNFIKTDNFYQNIMNAITIRLKNITKKSFNF